jgi:hypothetical protein
VFLNPNGAVSSVVMSGSNADWDDNHKAMIQKLIKTKASSIACVMLQLEVRESLEL